MTAYGHIGRYAEAPPDEAPTIWESRDSVMAALEDAGIPDFVADMFADLIERGYSDDAAGDFIHATRKQIEPIVERYAALMKMEEAA